jgi:hypothetical protein
LKDREGFEETKGKKKKKKPVKKAQQEQMG